MKRLYIDMDGTLVDFKAGIPGITKEQRAKYGDDIDDIPGYFAGLPPIDGALDDFHRLSEAYETYILSTAPWNNPSAWSDKVKWVHRHLPGAAHKRLILSHNKHLVQGDYLIDDRLVHGVDRFPGEHLHFGSDRFPDWRAVLEYLL